MDEALDAGRYVKERTRLLEQCVEVSRAFLASIEAWEKYDDFLERREDLITRVQQLDRVCSARVAQSVPKEDRAQMNGLLRLISGLDSDIISGMETVRQGTVESLKSLVQREKQMQYLVDHPDRATREGAFINRRK